MNRPKTDRELRDEAISAQIDREFLGDAIGAQIYRELGKEAMDLRKEAAMELRKEATELRTVEKVLRKVEKELRRIDKEVSKIEEIEMKEPEIHTATLGEDAGEVWRNLSRAAICDDVKNIICRERQDRYGAPEDSFKAIAEGWNWWLREAGFFSKDQFLTALDVADLMTILKIGRSIADPTNLDTRKDAAGYQVIAASMTAPREGVAEEG